MSHLDELQETRTCVSYQMVMDLTVIPHRIRMCLDQKIVHRVTMDIRAGVHQIRLHLKRDPRSAVWGFGVWFDASYMIPTADSTLHQTDFYGERP